MLVKKPYDVNEESFISYQENKNCFSIFILEFYVM